MQYKVMIYSIKKTKKGLIKKLIGSMVFSRKEDAIKQARCYIGNNIMAEVVEL